MAGLPSCHWSHLRAWAVLRGPGCFSHLRLFHFISALHSASIRARYP